MSAASILGLACVHPAQGQTRVAQIGDEADKSVRRLPRVDRMALQVARQALGGHPVEGLGLVVGTGYGGLQATVDFLEGVAVRGAAFGSPTSFHQSVHHSPAGQVSLSLKITGPCLTCSSREVSSEVALRQGLDLLSLRRCARVLVVCADEVVPALETAFKAFGSAYVPAEGAAAVLLGAEGGELELASVRLAGSSTGMLRWATPPPTAIPVNPAAGLINLVLAARALAPGASATLEGHSLGGAQATVVVRRK